MTGRSQATPPPWQTSDPPLVLHVIPTRRARGAQREARALVDLLDRPGVRTHRLLSLFAGPDEVRTDVDLGHPGGSTPAVGFDPRLVRTLRRTLSLLDPAVVVAHGSEPLKYLVPSLLGRRRPLAYYAIGTYSGSPGAVQLSLWRALIRRSDMVAAEGEEVAEECTTRFGLSADRVVVTPNGRDPTVFHPVAMRESGPPTLAFVGALTEGKRPEWFIDLAAALRAGGQNFRAVIIGDGPKRAEVDHAAQAAGVEVLGHRADVAEQLRSADILVFPSAPAGEGMPGVLIEAGLSGLPVVATAAPGVTSVVVDGQTGFVVGTGDRTAMAASVVRLMEDADLRHRLGRAARAHCLKQYSLDAVGQVWLDVLRPLLRDSGDEVEGAEANPAHAGRS